MGLKWFRILNLLLYCMAVNNAFVCYANTAPQTVFTSIDTLTMHFGACKWRISKSCLHSANITKPSDLYLTDRLHHAWLCCLFRWPPVELNWRVVLNGCVCTKTSKVTVSTYLQDVVENCFNQPTRSFVCNHNCQSLLVNRLLFVLHNGNVQFWFKDHLLS